MYSNSYDEEGSQKPIVSLRRFGLKASAHGIKTATATKGVARIFWICILCISFVFCFFQLYMMMEQYTKYETSTSVRLHYGELTFPAVTVCSMNPYRRSAAEKVPALRDLMNSYELAMKGTRFLSEAMYKKSD